MGGGKGSGKDGDGAAVLLLAPPLLASLLLLLPACGVSDAGADVPTISATTAASTTASASVRCTFDSRLQVSQRRRRTTRRRQEQSTPQNVHCRRCGCSKRSRQEVAASSELWGTPWCEQPLQGRHCRDATATPAVAMWGRAPLRLQICAGRGLMLHVTAGARRRMPCEVSKRAEQASTGAYPGVRPLQQKVIIILIITKAIIKARAYAVILSVHLKCLHLAAVHGAVAVVGGGQLIAPAPVGCGGTAAHVCASG